MLKSFIKVDWPRITELALHKHKHTSYTCNLLCWKLRLRILLPNGGIDSKKSAWAFDSIVVLWRPPFISYFLWLLFALDLSEKFFFFFFFQTEEKGLNTDHPSPNGDQKAKGVDNDPLSLPSDHGCGRSTSVMPAMDIYQGSTTTVKEKGERGPWDKRKAFFLGVPEWERGWG